MSNGHCLINNVSIPKNVINRYISYTLKLWLRNFYTDFTWNNCFFRSVKLNKNAVSDKYKYSGCSIGFDSRSKLLLTDGSVRRNVTIFWADMNSSVHINNKRKDFLILGDLSTHELDNTTLAAEAIYPINFTQTN